MPFLQRPWQSVQKNSTKSGEIFHKIHRKRLMIHRKRCIINIEIKKGGLIMTRKERKMLERAEKRANLEIAIAIIGLLLQIVALLTK